MDSGIIIYLFNIFKAIKIIVKIFDNTTKNQADLKKNSIQRNGKYNNGIKNLLARSTKCISLRENQ